MADLKAYFSLGSSSAGAWLDDRHIVYLRTGPDGKSLMRHDLKSGEETVLYNTQEGLRALYVAPGVDIFFSLDVGGAENLQIYRIPAAGGPPVPLTHDPATYHQLGGLLADGKTLGIAQNGRSKATFDIVGLDIETGAQRMILQNSDHYNTPAGLSPNGRYMMVNKMMGANNNPLWMVDTQTGTAVQTPDEGVTAAYGHPVWKGDGSGFYLTADSGSDFTYVAWYDVAKKTMEKRLEFNWDVGSLGLSADDRYLAVSVNEDGYSRLHIYDTQNERYVSIPQPPRGVIADPQHFQWSPTGHRLLFSATGATRPMDIWLLDLDADSLRRVTSSHMGSLTAGDFVEPTLHSFKSFDGLEVPYFLYLPRGAGGSMPVMISIHGGPEGQSRPGLAGKELLQYMLAQGIAVAEPNIRGSSGYGKAYLHMDDVEKRLDSVRDIECLAQHLVRTGVADRGRMGVMGGSYGGFMTLSCAARMPQLWCCAVCTVGMFNLVTFLENTSDYRRPHRESEYGTLARHRDVLFAVSPIAKVDDITGPLMIIHGQNDPRVPVSEAYQTKEYLSARGVEVDMLVYPDEGHGLQKLKNKLDCYPKVMDFIRRHMGL